MPVSLDTANLGAGTYEKQIAPFGTASIEQPGAFFYVLRAPVRINIKWDGGVYSPYEQGASMDLRPTGFGFRRLELHNPSAQTITVEIYAGWASYTETRSTSIPPRSRLQPAAVTSIPALGRVEFPTQLAPGDIQRAAFLISNNDGQNNLEIHAGGKPCLRVRPGDSITLPISGAFSVYNPNGAPVEAFMSEIFYTLIDA